MNRDLPDIPDWTEDEDVPLEVEASSFDLAAQPESVRIGTQTIRKFWETLPNSPGVYRMFDSKGEVLYVGKAKSLKSRVASYARGQAHSNRIARMIAQTASMEFVTTQTETEALLLESNLIKQLQPRYNVLLRDDKSLPYILISRDHAAPQLAKHRGARNRKGDYFGPFANAGAVTRTLHALQRAFLLRVCTDTYFENRTRPCLLYQIKRCSAPCTGEITPDDYAELVREAKAFLRGRSNSIKEQLALEMREASETLDFESAAKLRDRLAALSSVQGSQGINTLKIEEADVFAIDEQAGHFCVEVFFFRNWQNWGNRAYFPKADKATPLEEVLSSFIVQFYDGKPIPERIIVSHKLEDEAVLGEALSLRAGGKTKIVFPQRGEAKTLALNALRNAKDALSRKLAETASQEKLLAALGQALGLPYAPRRIEVYDNSHISGTNAVGAMIVAGPSGFMKMHYRSFNMPAHLANDDYAMMREVMTRRFSKMGTPPEGWGQDPPDTDAPFPEWPDLILIDGGKGQLEAARGALAAIGIDRAPLVGIAKGQDRDAGRETFLKQGQQPFRLAPRDPALYFVQRLRDEAHRFAIGRHRAKRKREIKSSPLDEISGIGPARKKALLNHFGTVKAISRASLEDLTRTPGINAETAQRVYEHFRG